MDVVSLCKDFYKLKDKRDGTFQGGRLLCDFGVNAVIEPAEDPSCVVKVAIPHLKPIRKEFETLRRLYNKGFHGLHYTFPQAITYGETFDFQYIVMSNLGATYANVKLSGESVAAVGNAVGTFAADLIEKDGTIHEDLHWGNLTQAKDNVTGVIDVETISPVVELEKMFRAPLVQYGDLASHIALGFTKKYSVQNPGFKLDLHRMLILSNEKNWPARRSWRKDDPFVLTAQDRIHDNLKNMERLFSDRGMAGYLIPLPN